ncbi:unnamed protein product [Periconia digitata]|uniref:Uncharacterized protein n=1 Tax=Periconia digitata TaxID=1303443 RepID=A0A9W4U560_9PLEO|nr:unnamed protein product [Periconia digitata]
MPRPNRYTPYSRHNSPRHVQPSTATIPQLPFKPMDSIEQTIERPYQYIAPGQIRGMTNDGQQLVMKSACKTADGTYLVEMEAVSLPSQDARLRSMSRQYTPMSTPPMMSPPMMSPPMSSPLMMHMIDPALLAFGIQSGEPQRKGSTGSIVSQDGRSIRSVSEECVALSDTEDAEGDSDDQLEQHKQALQRQECILTNLKAQKAAMNAAYGQ